MQATKLSWAAMAVCFLLVGLVRGLAAATLAPAKLVPTTAIVYKTTPQRKLRLYIFDPSAWRAGDSRPAMVFFFGGGWIGGSPSQFFGQAANLARRGMVAICVNYRVWAREKTTPFDSVKDAFSAMRWIRAHAKQLGINPGQIAAAGGSAGGQLAAAVATLTAPWTKEGKYLDVSPRPDALVLFNPVIDNGPHGYGYKRVKNHWQSFSPLENISKGMPPTLVMIGTKDQLVPMKTIEAFRQKILDLKGRCELVFFAGKKHGFFNYGPYYDQTMALMDSFLRSIHYLSAVNHGHYMPATTAHKGG
ncbi:MAG: alpha/beta hydrolase [Phycisphaerae bacterium]